MGRLKHDKVDCLQRYGALTNGLQDLVEFLMSEGLLSKELLREINSSQNVSKEIEQLLFELQTNGKLQLLEYDWSILPVERIKILIVTNKLTKEFTFNY